MSKIANSKYHNLDRLKNALISNACQDQTEYFRENYSILGDYKNSPKNNPFKDSLLDFAIMNISKDISILLIKDDAKCSIERCLWKCDYRSLDKVYVFINELISNKSFDVGKSHIHKGLIIRRLLDPDKVYVNKDRLSYIIELIRDKFLDSDEVKKIIDDIYGSDTLNQKYKDNFKMVNRELILNSLGI